MLNYPKYDVELVRHLAIESASHGRGVAKLGFQALLDGRHLCGLRDSFQREDLE
jgi:hypothetical protein